MRSEYDDYGIGSVRQCTDAYVESVLNVCTRPKEKTAKTPCKHDDP